MNFIAWILSKLVKLIWGRKADVFYYSRSKYNKWLIVSEVYKDGFIGNRPWGEGRTLKEAWRDICASNKRYR